MRQREALSALPSPAARALAFVAILLGGLAGGLIGYAFVDLQCDAGCATAAAVGAWVTAVGAAIGTAVIAVLSLRAMGEWRQLGDRDTEGAMTAVAADFRELRDLAARLARQAGDAVADRRRSGPLAALTKSSPTDMVTELDHLSESLIVEGLTAERPGDAILGEEGTARSGTTGVAWLVDPVDGTTNLLYGLPEWSVSIAATFAGATVAGVVYAPMLGELYSAVTGDGASRDGQPIRCSATVEVASALVATGFSYLAPRRVAQGAAVAALLPRVRDIRRLGSAALDLCFVATGRVDGYFERGLNPWDLAAGELIAREAGATTTDFAGGPASTSDVVAAPPQLHPALLTLLQQAGA